MYQILKRIAITGIKTESPPRPDAALRVAGERLKAEVLANSSGALTTRARATAVNSRSMRSTTRITI